MSKSYRHRRFRRDRRKIYVPRIRPYADPRLKHIFAAIGAPEQRPFQPDPFQLQAVDAVARADCLVTAPTGSGKTWIAEQAIARMLENGCRSWYASPLKALTNSKYIEFGERFGVQRVGILTGDRKENPDAPVIVGTTEILRNQLYDAMSQGEDVPTDFVILDEAHYLGDRDRGVVWEEVMIYLPPSIPLLMLSATIGNAKQISRWLASIRNRPCEVVKETRRPVELRYLFLHPSGTLFPLLARGKKQRRRGTLDKKVQAYVDRKNPPVFGPPNELPPFGKILRILRRYQLLPALFFLKSRADCDRALALCEAQPVSRTELLRQRISERLEMEPYLASHAQLAPLQNSAVGAHHAGQLPAWKLLLETLMQQGLLDAIFATSTVAAGVNFPARSVVFLNSDRFDGQQFMPLTATEFHQMIGRAGRRGMDKVGFAIALPAKYMDLQAIARLTASGPLPVLSRIKIDFSMVLNLLLSHTPDQIKDLLQKSFATHVKGKDSHKVYRSLARDFNRRLYFLIEQEYVNPDGTLTPVGKWASQLRVDQPLLIAECLRRGVLPHADPALLAALVASFVNDREMDDPLDRSRLPKPLVRAFVRVRRSLGPFILRVNDRKFETRPLYLRPAITLYAWASGQPWAQVVARSGMAEGDLTMLVSRTADNLRHISTLWRVFPDVAATARQAIEAIMRQPVMVF